MKYKLGKLPGQDDGRTLKFAHYRRGPIVVPPKRFGHAGLVSDWQMLGNDQVGNCAIVDALHLIMMWAACMGRKVRISTACAIQNYSEITGYNPDDPSTDRGTNMLDLMKHWRNVGMVDDDGSRHKIDAFVELRPGNIIELCEATYLFDGASIGFQLPASAETQFDEHEPWRVIPRSPIVGGHATPAVLFDDHLNIVTWERLQAVTNGFYATQCDEAYGAVSREAIDASGKSLEGYDIDTLIKDAGILSGQ